MLLSRQVHAWVPVTIMFGVGSIIIIITVITIITLIL